MSEEKNNVEEKASFQEENWRLMTVLQVPWHHANKIDDPLDRAFLLEKADEVEGYLKQQQDEMSKQMEQQMQQQGMDGQNLTGPPSSTIITPSDPMANTGVPQL